MRVRSLVGSVALLATAACAFHSRRAEVPSVVGPTTPRRLATTDAPLRYVNPFIGTRGPVPASPEYGGTIPGVTRPFGMTQWTAATRPNRIGVNPYHYDDTTIEGFLGTHQPAIWMGDYGYVSLMPGVGEIDIGRRAPFRHESEIAAPNYYAVDLLDPAGTIRVDLAATERVGFLRFAFPPNSKPHVVLHAIRNERFVGWVRIDPATQEIAGYNPDRQSAHLGPDLPNFKGWFAAKFSRPFSTYGTADTSGILRTGRLEQKGVDLYAFASFAPNAEPLLVKVGTSFISLEQARDNLAREIGAWDLDATRAAGHDAWTRALGVLDIRGGTETDRTVFYTALYHALLFPRRFSEYGRYYSAFDDRVHQGVSYNDFSLWDTFRAEHPLLSLVAPREATEMVTSLIQMAEEGGRLPIWPNPAETNIMISTHAECVIADAFVKGLRGFDVKKGYAAAYREATVPPAGDTEQRWEDRLPWTGPPAPPAGRGYEGRGGLTFYDSLGYVPADRTEESVSRTVEFGVDDYCTAQMARELSPAAAEHLIQRSRNYRHLYNPATGLLEPKDSKGSWFPSKAEGFTEGNPWTYAFGAMHDIPGMIEMMGGPERFVRKLDEDFDGGHHRHDNEPGHHYPYLYDYAGQPWKTQARVRDILARQYRDRPDGLAGNDDCGQMSAWYVFSAMGLYPVTPASGIYALGSPLFEEIVLHLAAGTFVVRAKNQSPSNVYVQAARLNGRALAQPFLRHADLVRGDTVLEFELGPRPNTALWR